VLPALVVSARSAGLTRFVFSFAVFLRHHAIVEPRRVPRRLHRIGPRAAGLRFRTPRPRQHFLRRNSVRRRALSASFLHRGKRSRPIARGEQGVDRGQGRNHLLAQCGRYLSGGTLRQITGTVRRSAGRRGLRRRGADFLRRASAAARRGGFRQPSRLGSLVDITGSPSSTGGFLPSNGSVRNRSVARRSALRDGLRVLVEAFR